jgi:hypothetical protein
MRNASQLLLSAPAILLCGCVHFDWSDTHSVKGSGNVITETREVSQFDRVAISGSGHVSIVQGDKESLTIEADDNLLPLIKSDVTGGLLKVGPENVNLNPSRTIQYQLHLKHLKELHLSGSLDAEAGAIQSDQLRLMISGSGNIHIAALQAGDLDVHISGSGGLQLSGKVNRQTVRVSGSGSYRAGDCESQDTSVHISGSGDATVWAQQKLEGHVSGSGDVNYYGSPQVNTQVSGSGSVHPVGKR